MTLAVLINFNMLFVSIFILSFSAVLASSQPCKDIKGSVWIADPQDCSTFFVCIRGIQFKYQCPENTVTDAGSKTCVPKGSRLDKCTSHPAQGQPDVNQEKPKPNQEKPEVDQGKPIPNQLKPVTDQSKPTTNIEKPDQDHGIPNIVQGIIQVQNVCQKTMKGKLGHSNCAKYIDCKTGFPEVQECPYPQLYDVKTEKCSSHDKVLCQNRHEPKSPCDYDANQCGFSSHCVPCKVRYPSCEGLKDGPNPWTGREWTPYFVICYRERVTFQSKCSYEESSAGSYVFDPRKNRCVDAKKLDN